jgi:hypothetical protein
MYVRIEDLRTFRGELPELFLVSGDKAARALYSLFHEVGIYRGMLEAWGIS